MDFSEHETINIANGKPRRGAMIIIITNVGKTNPEGVAENKMQSTLMIKIIDNISACKQAGLNRLKKQNNKIKSLGS